MITAMTYETVARELGERPCVDDFKQACDVLPDWKNTAYTPTEMAAHGVKYSSIMWAWMRPQALGRQGVVEAACRMAERVLPIFEAAHPDDDRPRKAIEAAMAWVKNPSEENKRLAARADDAAAAAAAAAYFAADAAARAAAAAAAAAYFAADAAAAVAAAVARAAAVAAVARATRAADADGLEAERAAQIAIIEAVIADGEPA